MDAVSHRLANALVGNRASLATLEVTLVGPELEFHDDRLMVVCGAEIPASVDDRPVPPGKPIQVGPGSRCRFGERWRGARAYLAISGGIDVPEVLGSRSTHLATRMGGLHGRPLAAGDTLPLGTPQIRHAALSVSQEHLGLIRRPLADTTRVRVLAGPQVDRLRADALSVLQSAPYTVSSQSDRMGYRLDGPALHAASAGFLLSEATIAGALQIPANGQPILLTADRQTTGGYPTLAAVIAADMGLVGQFAPGDAVSFVVCSRQEAAAALLAQERLLMTVEGRGAA
jgi:antagonist of KipI